ncbi:hypothetical protein Fcan01_01695 [Folsomia candida]|uniref:Uncharacterized protein n=1 Tax=Folsomia candida TaxID=158441 RepID=A0A226F6K9_FOLCA|nr:hypothetical protein Fcan01_01695 [Folsomia candida]
MRPYCAVHANGLVPIESGESHSSVSGILHFHTSVKLYLGLSALLPPTVRLPTANRRLSSYPQMPLPKNLSGISNYRLHAHIYYRPHPRSSLNADPHPPDSTGQNYQAGKSHNLDFLLVSTLSPFPTAEFQTTASMLAYVIDRTPVSYSGISNYRLHAHICYRPHPRSSFTADPHPPNPSGQNYQTGKSHDLDFLLILTLSPFPTAGFQTTASMLTYVIDRTPGHHLLRTRTRQIPLVKITKPVKVMTWTFC